MKNYLVLIVMFLSLGFLTKAQNKEKILALSLYTGFSDYNGELNPKFFNVNNVFRTQLGGNVFFYLNKSIDLGIDFGYGSHGFYDGIDHYKGEVFKGFLSARYKLANGLILDEGSRTQPFVFLGGGFANHFIDLSSFNEPGLDYTLNTGLGVKFRVTENLSLQYQMNLAFTTGDNRDLKVGGSNDKFIIHSLGFVIPVGPIPDADLDGIADKRDRCPNTPQGVQVDAFGCPYDRDFDGIADYQDECPDLAGTPSMNGCDDKDLDGIMDLDDLCPTVAGSPTAFGCPDRDLDSIVDDLDDCPDVFGTLAFNGCPDTDNDSLRDIDDLCPEIAGLVKFKGCPDTDGDGLSDIEDECPEKMGTIANRGCPAEVEDIVLIKQLETLENIQFETGKNVIRKVSYSKLHQVVKIMTENPTYYLTIKGHTDDVGEDAANLKLSVTRANSVLDYITEKGIDSRRITPTGVGEREPKYSNDDAQGRAKNRRVEFSLQQ
ncbi:MAG: OOP family OmpA-OmpF porin [Psychromonas sp.]|jgi:OOP family OmpA-OmpF porin